MKQTIRMNTFETNSSSTHSLVLFGDVKINLDDIKFDIVNMKTIEDEYEYRTSKDIIILAWSLAVLIKQCGEGYYADSEFLDYTTILKNMLPNCVFHETEMEKGQIFLDMKSRFLDCIIAELEVVLVDGCLISRDNYINFEDYFENEMFIDDMKVLTIRE